MITEQQIRHLAEDKIQETDNYLVDVIVKPGNRITVLLDNDNGISITDCIAVSRHIEGSLDRETEDFDLEVSSPGLDQPFKIKRQYHKYVGKQVSVTLKNGEKIQGELQSAGEDNIQVETRSKEKVEGKKSKQLIIKEHTINYQEIKETKFVLSF